MNRILMRNLGAMAGLTAMVVTGLAGCSGSGDAITRLEGTTMGTTYQVMHPRTAASLQEEQEAIDALLAEINQSLSTYIETSSIWKINASSDTTVWHVIDRHFEIVFDRARVIYEDTQGAFNPAVGPLVNAWGFGPNPTEAPPDDAMIDVLLSLVDFESFRRGSSPPAIQKGVPGARLDLSAIAKGYGVDAVAALLEARGIRNYFVEIGGEVRVRGQHPAGRPWRVGIERPFEDAAPVRALQVAVSLNDAALATSGNYRNYHVRGGRKYVHIVNPATGYPEVSSLLSVSVLAEDCMTADAYATALMVMGLKRARAFVEQREGLEAYFISGDGEGRYLEEWSSGFPPAVVQ